MLKSLSPDKMCNFEFLLYLLKILFAVLTSRYGGPVQDTENDDAWSFPEDDEPSKLAPPPPEAPGFYLNKL